MFIDGPVDPPLTRAYADPTRAPIRWAAILCGIFFLVIGFSGFFPGVTTHLNEMEMAQGSEAMLLGIFQVSVLHNIIHLLMGFAGLALSRFSYLAHRYLLVVGGLSAVLWIFGLLVPQDSMTNFLPLNAADNWAYLVVAVTLIGLSFLPREADPPSVADRRP